MTQKKISNRKNRVLIFLQYKADKHSRNVPHISDKKSAKFRFFLGGGRIPSAAECNHTFRFDFFLCVCVSNTRTYKKKSEGQKRRGSPENIKSATMHVTLRTKEALELFEWNIAVIAHSVGYRCGPYNGLQRIVWKNREKKCALLSSSAITRCKRNRKNIFRWTGESADGVVFPLWTCWFIDTFSSCCFLQTLNEIPRWCQRCQRHTNPFLFSGKRHKYVEAD